MSTRQKKLLFCLCFLLTIFIIQCGNSNNGTVYKLYYLGGQSNMDGYGFVKELPENYALDLENVFIFHGNTSPDKAKVDGKGIWAKLRPGHGAGFKSDGTENKYSDRFGVELSFAGRIKELEPNSNIAIIKYSRGGTSIDKDAAGKFGCWEPDFDPPDGVNQYDHFIAAVKNAFFVKDINGDNKPDKLIPAGIIWMQGESDASYSEEIAGKYEMNLKRLMDLIRDEFKSKGMPVVIGRISDSGKDEDGKVWDQGEIVRDCQASFVKNDGNAALVTSTDKYKYSDPWHYDTNGFIDLGKEFADAIFKLQKK